MDEVCTVISHVKNHCDQFPMNLKNYMSERLTKYKEMTAPMSPENWDFIHPSSLSYPPPPQVKRRTHFPIQNH